MIVGYTDCHLILFLTWLHTSKCEQQIQVYILLILRPRLVLQQIDIYQVYLRFLLVDRHDVSLPLSLGCVRHRYCGTSAAKYVSIFENISASNVHQPRKFGRVILFKAIRCLITLQQKSNTFQKTSLSLNKICYFFESLIIKLI